MARSTRVLTLVVAALLVHGISAETAARQSPLEDALAYVTALAGTRYGWWKGGIIPASAPAWAANGPPPPKSEVDRRGQMRPLPDSLAHSLTRREAPRPPPLPLSFNCLNRF
jgi:hypothetical protein